MAHQALSLVTGANGHLGYNLVRLLLQKGLPVRASVRSLDKSDALKGLGCDIVQADITDKASLKRALEGVEVFYAVGAAFKLWAKDPQKEIYEVNLQGTRHMIEAAAEAGVKKIIYVSSIAALNYTQLPTREQNGYNPDRRDAYYNSKNDGERLAFELAAQYGISLVAVLPSAMIGGQVTTPLSVSYNVLKLILNREVPVETHITLNWVDVKDVAEGCYLAATRGQGGQRYILANEQCTSIKDTTRIARALYPERNIKLPLALPKALLYAVAWLMEVAGRIQGKAPLLSVKDVAMFSGLQQNFDISKARTELGFEPKPPVVALKEAMQHLVDRRLVGMYGLILLWLFGTLTLTAHAQQTQAPTTAPKQPFYVSVETDPAFWLSTLPNGGAFDLNLNIRPARYPRLRLGVMGYTGRWSGDLAKSLLLTPDFKEDNWQTQWNGAGLEAQYQFRFGLPRGGLQPGLRLQWNQFVYRQDAQRKADADHLVLTPQVGFQWFPFKKLGLYVLPWAGIQLPVAGTDQVTISQEQRQTQKPIPVLTAHIGWEFSIR